MRKALSFAPIAGGALFVASVASAQDRSTNEDEQPPQQAPAPSVAQTTTVVVVPPSQTTTTAAVVPGAPVSRDVEVEEVRGPNRYLLVSGAILLGVPYLTSMIVAGSSNRRGDSHLYVPIAGPWLDLGDRGGCTSGAMCDVEATNKLGLVINGILQAAGMVQIVGAFVFPEKRVVTTTVTQPALHVTPAKVGRTGYGLALGIEWAEF